MNIHADRYETDKALQVVNTPVQSSVGNSAIQLQDNRPKSVIQKKQAEAMAAGSPKPVQAMRRAGSVAVSAGSTIRPTASWGSHLAPSVSRPNSSSIAPAMRPGPLFAPSVLRSNSMPNISNRKLHIAAAGSLRKFNKPSEVAQLPPRTIISTLMDKNEAEGHNELLPSTVAALEAQGHGVAFGVDATQLHNQENPGTAALNAIAKKKGADLSKLNIDYLRSESEASEDDEDLIEDSMLSAGESGVEELGVRHINKRHEGGPTYFAPGRAMYKKVGAKTGWKPSEESDEEPGRDVESVPKNGAVKTVSVKSSASTKFKREELSEEAREELRQKLHKKLKEKQDQRRPKYK